MLPNPPCWFGEATLAFTPTLHYAALVLGQLPSHACYGPAISSILNPQYLPSSLKMRGHILSLLSSSMHNNKWWMRVFRMHIISIWGIRQPRFCKDVITSDTAVNNHVPSLTAGSEKAQVQRIIHKSSPFPRGEWKFCLELQPQQSQVLWPAA